MTNDERAQLEVLRAEMNGKLDLLLERTDNLRTAAADHEARLRSLEDEVAPTAQAAYKDLSSVKKTLEGVKVRMWMAVGGLGVVVFGVNIAIAKGWF